ncbi:hypothetical protein [Pandoraea anhela]|uniref:Uncharacterized protein n=1 Tax=Pandoraea anhela TaxID=2508295 RepID=A0A5E4TXX4_9BURK|nr:hypothetical protein [Pandoraea anhela]VVD92687.1 hypothetical protein PAN31108_01702 [Pandoraea anhela]
MRFPRKAALAGLLSVAAISAHSQDISAEFSRCSATQNDKQRLACYDAIRDRAAAGAKTSQDKNGSQQVALADLKTDIKDLVGKRVSTKGNIQAVGGEKMVLLKSDMMDMTPVTMNGENLPRDDRKKLLNDCQHSVCKGSVTGRIRKGPLGPELVAETVVWQ